MKLSVNWLRDYVDIPEDVDALCERLTTLGLEVEAVERIDHSFPGVVVGKVLEAVQHPNADKLRLCKVDVGSETLGIVCGASNVRAGLRVAVATVGSVLPGDFKIKKSKIRGEESHGMICSERELGLGQGHEGILELDGEPAIGRPLDELFGYQDTCIEIEVTPNRPDWLSHIGVARELAAAYRSELRIPDPGHAADARPEDRGWSARIEDREGCRRFTGRLIDGAKVGVSPLWMRKRLLAIGQRPINSIVDASNYVLHECGQPTHVFDRTKLHASTIVLRRARPGEAMQTLDDERRELGGEHLVVADEMQAIAIAGIMGGGNSEVDATSSDLLVEVAEFHPQVVRRGRRVLGLNTDASYRFERGIDRGRLEWASRRVTQLIVESSGGMASPHFFDAVGEAAPAPASFEIRPQQVRRVVGVEIALDEMHGILERLQIPVKRDGERLAVVQPTFRHDLLEEIDGIEEIARHHGYDRLPVADRAPMLRPAERTPRERQRRKLRETLAARRYHEVVGSSFMPDDDPQRLGIATGDPRATALRVLNPVVAGASSLRTTSLPEMIRMLDRNRRRGHVGPVRLFQLDRCFIPEGGELPREAEGLVVLWAGPAETLHFQVPEREFGIYDALGEVDALLAACGLRAEREPTSAQVYHRAGSGVTLRLGAALLGTLGQLDPRVALRFELEEPVYLCELDLAAISASVEEAGVRRFAGISSYPPVRRDLSLLIPKDLPYARVSGVVREGFGVLLESVEVFDLYEGPQVPVGQRAVGLRLSLRSGEGTLKDQKVDALLRRVLELLDGIGVRLRDAGPLPQAGKGD